MAIFNPVNVPVISKITVNGEVHYLKDAEARALLLQLGDAAKKNVAAGITAEDQGLVTAAQVRTELNKVSGGLQYVGQFESLDAANNSGTEFKNGDIILVGNKEYIYYGGEWNEMGDEGIYALKSTTIAGLNLEANISVEALQNALGLGALAYKSSAEGTVAGEVITGVKATGTSAGTIDVALTQTSTAATLTTAAYKPVGEVTGTVVAAGNVSIAKSADGTEISGTVSAPTVTVTPATTTLQHIDSVGTQASKAADTFIPNGDDTFTQGSQAAWAASVDDNETLSFSFTANSLPTFVQGAKASYIEGTFTPNELPTKGTAVTVVTGIESAVASAPVFTGDKFAATFSGTSANIAATFAGAEEAGLKVTGVNYDKAAVDTANTKFNAGAIELAVGDITVASKAVTVQ